MQFWNRTSVRLLLVGLVIGASSQSLCNAQSIGTVDHMTGSVTILDITGQSHAAHVADTISEGTTVTTGADGEVLFKMVDDGAVALRPNSQVRFTEYRFQSRDTDSVLFNLAKGSVRALTGIIGKLHPAQAKLRTPTATIGVRGTDHETLVLVDDTDDGKAGTYDRVFEGQTFIEADNGQQLNVDANQVGFSPLNVLAVATQLGLLRNVPPFFKTGKFDDLFALLSQELQQELQRRLQKKIADKVPAPLQQLMSVPGLGNLFGK